MKTKKTIINFIFLAGLAIALTACGASTVAKQRASQIPSGSAGTVGSPLQGYWQGQCQLNGQTDYQFDGTTFKQYQDVFQSSDCSDDFPLSTTEVDGTFQVSAEGTQGAVQLTPNNGQAATIDEYFLNGSTLTLEGVTSSQTVLSPETFTKYTGN